MTADTPSLVAGDAKTGAGEAIPELILAAGKPAVEQHRAYFDEAIRSPNARKLYGQHARRFCRWASERGHTLESIDATAIAAYAADVAGSKASHVVRMYLTPLRGLFCRLVSAGVLSESPDEL